MLTLESVTYRYAGARRPSLHDVSLELHDGEVLGLAGASEAGKTTLCLVASGLAPRTVGGTLTGRVVLDDEDTTSLAMHELAGRVGIAFASPATQLSGVAATAVADGPISNAHVAMRTRTEALPQTVTCRTPRLCSFPPPKSTTGRYA